MLEVIQTDTSLQWSECSTPLLDSSRQIPSDTKDLLCWPTSLTEEVTADLKMPEVFGSVSVIPERKEDTVACPV